MTVSQKQFNQDARALSSLLENDEWASAEEFIQKNPHVLTGKMVRTERKWNLYIGDPFLKVVASRAPLSTVKVFIAAGAPLEARDKEGATPLVVTANKAGMFQFLDRHEVAMELLRAGARGDAVGDKLVSPIYTTYGDMPHRLVEAFIKAGSPLNGWVTDGVPVSTVAYLARLCNMSGSEHRKQTLRMVVEAGADLNADVNSVQFTALGQMLRGGDVEMAQWMVAQGANWRARGNDGQSIMFCARSPAAVAWVVEKDPALLDAPDRGGNTPLLELARQIQDPQLSNADRAELCEAAKALIMGGADLRARDNQGVMSATPEELLVQSRIATLGTFLGSLAAAKAARAAIDEMADVALERPKSFHP